MNNKSMNINRMKIVTMLYSLGYSLIIISKLCDKVDFLPIKIIKIISIIMLFVSFLFEIKRYSIRELIIVMFLFIVGILTYYYSKSDLIFILFLTFIPLKYVNTRSVINVDMILKIGITIFLLLFYILGYIHYDILFERDGKIRYAFGFSHPNILAFTLMCIETDFLFLRKENTRWFYSISAIFFIIFIYLFTDSRASILYMIYIYILCIFYNKTTYKMLNIKIIKFFVVNSFIIFTILSISLRYII